MTLSFMIKKRYLAEKVAEQEADGTFHERREYKPFWRKRIGSVDRWKLKSSMKIGRNNDKAIFLCGTHTFMAYIVNITIDEPLHGIEDVVSSALCYNIECRFDPDELPVLYAFLENV